MYGVWRSPELGIDGILRDGRRETLHLENSRMQIAVRVQQEEQADHNAFPHF